MKYMLLICAGGRPRGSQSDDADGLTIEEWVEQMDSSGVRLMGQRLRPPQDATTVAVVDGKLTLSDGPFIETKEYIAGFDIIECRNLDHAIEVAAKHPMARGGRVEVRPFWEGDD